VAEAMVERMMEAPAVQAKRTYSIMMRQATKRERVFLGIGAPLCSVFLGEKEWCCGV
jgi:hypothetical protein